MDEPSQQLLHEYRHAEAKAFFGEMADESSSPGLRHDASSAPTMASAPAPTQKELFGEALFPKVQVLQPQMASRVIRVLLELDNSELINLIENESALREAVDESLTVCRQIMEKEDANGRGDAATSLSSPTSQTCQQNQMSPLQASLLAGKFSDLLVVHREKEWKAHKIVVCSASAVLESMIPNEGGPISILDLKDYPGAAVSCLMSYLYKNTYTTRDAPPDFSLNTHIKVFNLAVTFAIPSLQAFAEHRFRCALNNHVTDLKVYYTSIRQIYATTTREHSGLRNAVIEAAVSEMNTLLNSENVRKYFFEFLGEVPEFHADVLRWLVDNPDRPVQLVVQQLCEECGPMSEDKKYVLDTECNGCGKMKSMEFY